jgi:2-polyprenyl-3-methyl-5-hydroxy-6-metoxy-1,4-benzoquinol methylase
MPSPMHLISHYKNLSKTGSYSKANSHFRHHSILDFLDRCKPTSLGKNWLDYGCFDGGLLQDIQHQGYVGFGVEIQEESRLIAQSRATGKVVESLKENLIEHKISIISMKDSIEHLVDPNDLFIDLVNLIEHETDLFIQTPNARSLSALILGKRWACLNSPEHTILFSKHSLKIFLNRHGWEVKETKRVSKLLTIGYVLNQLEHFGGFQKQSRFLLRITPKIIKNIELRFLGGEFFAHAVRQNKR